MKLSILRKSIILCFLIPLLMNCSSDSDAVEGGEEGDEKETITEDIKVLKFFDEFIIPEGFRYDNVEVGGLSDLSYDGDYFYTVSDRVSDPRIFKFSLDFKEEEIDTLRFEKTIPVSAPAEKDLVFDSEGIDFDPETNHFTLSSEGNIEAGDDGFVAELNNRGELTALYDLPEYFKASFKGGPQNNGVFEGLCQSVDKEGAWVATELPLKMDLPTDEGAGQNWIRFTRFDKNTKEPTEQFVYPLEGFAGESTIAVNGVSAILEYRPHRFLVLERSFSTEFDNLGFQAEIFTVDARKATNTLAVENMSEREVTPADSRLLLDLQEIKKDLTHTTLDNLEGISLGPVLPNGNPSLVLISDNNFNGIIQQLNQLIVLEVVK